MKIRILPITFFLLLAGKGGLNAQITLSADRADAFYDVGDSVYFVVNAGISDSVRYFIQRDPRLPYIASGAVWVAAGVEKRIAYKSRQPDMIVCTVQGRAGAAVASAAIGPFDLNAYEPEPPDFDAFWAQQKARLRQIPMNPKLTLLSSSDYSTTYSIQLNTVAQRKIYGFISIPKGKGPFPAILTMPAFGDAANIVTPEQEIAERGGAISLTIGIHNTPPDQVDSNAYLPNNYRYRDSVYYLLSILAGVRAVDYLFTRPDFDGRSLGLTGVSQGGGLCALVAGIDGRAKTLTISAPPIAEHTGERYRQASAFPFYYNTVKDFDLLTSESVLAATKYFDGVIALRRYKGAALVCTGYEDGVAPPAVAYSLFNQIRGPKLLTQNIYGGHDHPDLYWEGRFDFWRRIFPSMLNPPKPYVTPNTGYFVDAGADTTLPAGARTLALKGKAYLNGALAAGFPVKWRKTAGPGPVAWSSNVSSETTASFSRPGVYLLTLYADDNSQLPDQHRRLTCANSIKVVVP